MIAPPDPSVMQQGIELMLFGMGTVFIFLTLLVGVTSLMSRVLTRWWPEQPVLAAGPRALPGRPNEPSAEVVAAVVAAVSMHRARHAADPPGPRSGT